MDFQTTELAPSGRELIAFRLGSQDFCVDVQQIREIRGWTPATPLPNTPHYVRGVINLRGAVLPIVDLAHRLGFKPLEPSARSVIIVAEIGSQLVGLLVEAVSDILTVPESKIQPTPDIASETAKTFLRGVMTIEGRMVTLLALDKVLPAPVADKAA